MPDLVYNFVHTVYILVSIILLWNFWIIATVFEIRLCYCWDCGWNLCRFLQYSRRPLVQAPLILPSPIIKGKDGTPHYSLSSRYKELIPFNTLGPGTYGPEKKPTCFQEEKQSPAYSIGGRSKYRRCKQKIYVSDVNCTMCVATLFLIPIAFHVAYTPNP